MKLFSRNVLAVMALVFPVAALADVTGTPTLTTSTSTLNLDTGATGTSGGDVSWNGTAVTPQGSATAVDLASTPIGGAYSGLSGFNQLVSAASSFSSALASEFGSYLTTSPITPAANDILVVHTHGGNYAAVLVTAITGTSIALKFHTFNGSSTTTSSGPSVSSLQNNYSYIQPGLPSYGIAPGSLFIIYGSDLSDKVTPVLQSSAAPGLPTTLNHTTISVTVGGKTTTPGIYYTSPTQIAAVLPSSTPTGSGTITVTYNGTASSPATILVTKSAFGMDTLYGTGTGGIVATDGGGNAIVPTASANPGQTITIWGSGLGADTANDDKTFPLKQDNLKNAQVYIGGVKATVTYDGRSQYPGVDQVDVVVPQIGTSPAFETANLQSHDVAHATGFQGGCGLSVVVVANGIDSNFGTLPVNPGGGVCSDPESGITGTNIGTFGGQSNFKYGFVDLYKTTEPASDSSSAKPAAGLKSPASLKSSVALKPAAQAFTTTYYAIASFTSVTGASYASSGSFTSIGSCIVSGYTATSVTSTETSKGLDAGTPITLTGGGLSLAIPELSINGKAEVGSYDATLANALLGGTAYTFTGTGGKDVGPFKATITFPVPLDWTNESSTGTVTESQGQLITWKGGASGTYVEISGSSSSADFSAFGSFVCLAPVSDGQFTVPSYVLLALPQGSGSLGVANFSDLVGFTAPGIDYGYAIAGAASDETVTYQ